MNRVVIILIAFVIIAAAAGAGFFYLRSQPSATPAGQTQGNAIPSDLPSGAQTSDSQSKTAVQTALKTQMAEYFADGLQLGDTVISGNYAVQLWSTNHMGGEALLQYAQNRWTVITYGGGVWSLQGLLTAGVPRDTATVLLKDIPHSLSPKLR